METEFKQLLHLLDSPIIENKVLGLQIAVNYKNEIEDYYIISFNKWKDLYIYEIHQHLIYERRNGFWLNNNFIFFCELHSCTFDNFFRDLFAPDYYKEIPLSIIKELDKIKKYIVLGRKPRIKDLELGKKINKIIIDKWLIVKNLIMNNDKTYCTNSICPIKDNCQRSIIKSTIEIYWETHFIQNSDSNCDKQIKIVN